MRAIFRESDEALLPARWMDAGLMSGRRLPPPPPIAAPSLPVPAFEFSTLNLPPRHQFLAWRDSYAPIIELLAPERPSAIFAGKQTLWDMGGMALSHVRSDGLAFARVGRDASRHVIDHWLISLLVQGRSKTITHSRAFEAHAGAVQVHALGKPFRGHISDCEMLQLFIPRDFFRGMANLLEAVEFSTIENSLAALFADHIVCVARRLPSLDVDDLPRLVAATRAMILAFIAPSPDHLHDADDAINDVLLQRACRLVQANMFSPALGARSLQRELGVSRSRLYRMFEPHGGVVHYIQHRRLLDAHAALADAGDLRNITDIAEQHGFTDAAGFSRAFKREFGYSPSEVRSAHKRSPQRRPDVTLEGVAPRDRLGTLLRRLQS